MIGSGKGFVPSKIENEIYDLIEEYEIGLDRYEKEVSDEIMNYFSCKKDIQWQLDCAEWPDMTGGVCYVSFIENNVLHMLKFEYKVIE